MCFIQSRVTAPGSCQLSPEEFKQKPWTCSDAFGNTQHQNFYVARLETGLWVAAHIKPELPEEQHLADAGGDRFQVKLSSWEVPVLSLKPEIWFSLGSDPAAVTDFISAQAICWLLTIFNDAARTIWLDKSSS